MPAQLPYVVDTQPQIKMCTFELVMYEIGFQLLTISWPLSIIFEVCMGLVKSLDSTNDVTKLRKKVIAKLMYESI